MNRADLKAFKDSFGRLDATQKAAQLGALSAHDLEELQYTWEFWARDNQMPPDDDRWLVWLYCAGRGTGKTVSTAQLVRKWVSGSGKDDQGRPIRVALIGRTHNDILNTYIRGESGLLNCYPPNERKEIEVVLNQYTIRFPNGALAFWYTSEEPDKLRGPQHHYAACDELASWLNLEETWSNLKFGLRLGRRPRIAVATTPRPLSFLKALVKDPRTATSWGSTYENLANLSETFRADIAAYEGTRLGRQEIHGEILDDSGCLFQGGWIRHNAMPEASKVVRSIVAIDPATTNNKDSDETGIIPASLDVNGTCHIMGDYSGKYSPDEWANRAIKLYHDIGAQYIVIESNQGGDAWETIIKSKDPSVRIYNVHARQGKELRAEPVAAMYQRGLVNHPLGIDLGALEKQMDSFPLDRKKDRVDAMVYAVSALLLNLIPPPRGTLGRIFF